MASVNVQAQLKRGELLLRFSYQTTSLDRKTISTGYKIPATKIRGVYKYWDNKKQRVKPGAENCEEINQFLQLKENKFLDYLKECKDRNRAPRIEEITLLLIDKPIVKAPQLLRPIVISTNPETVTIAVTPKPTPKTKQATMQYLKDSLGPVNDLTPALKLYLMYCEEKASDLKHSSFKHYKVFGMQLQKFEKQRVTGPINVNAIDVKFYREFTQFMIGEQDNVNSTINRKVTRLKTFLNWCMEEGYISVGTYKKKYILDEVEASKFPLYDDEVTAFKKYIPKAGTESMVYWAFRFAICTGLRYGDICHVNPSNVKYIDANEETGERLYYLDFVEEKTRERTAVPLTKEALEILAKAKENSNDKLFTIPTDQECNRTLKDIGEAIGLDRVCELKQFQGKELITEYAPLKEVISFHFARYTYITSLLHSGLNPLYVQENVGHNKLETTLGYNRDIDVKRLKETLLIQEKIRIA